jgi:predicted RNA-binding Zn-ribbon protein involved in translation (DUF1610 family)
MPASTLHEHEFTQRPIPNEEAIAVGRQLIPKPTRVWMKSFHCSGCGAALLRVQACRDGGERRAIRFPGLPWAEVNQGAEAA